MSGCCVRGLCVRGACVCGVRPKLSVHFERDPSKLPRILYVGRWEGCASSQGKEKIVLAAQTDFLGNVAKSGMRLKDRRLMSWLKDGFLGLEK